MVEGAGGDHVEPKRPMVLLPGQIGGDFADPVRTEGAERVLLGDGQLVRPHVPIFFARPGDLDSRVQVETLDGLQDIHGADRVDHERFRRRLPARRDKRLGGQMEDVGWPDAPHGGQDVVGVRDIHLDPLHSAVEPVFHRARFAAPALRGINLGFRGLEEELDEVAPDKSGGARHDDTRVLADARPGFPGTAGGEHQQQRERETETMPHRGNLLIPVRAALLVFRFPEPGQHVAVAPSGVPHPLPLIEVRSGSPHIHHAVDRTGSAQYLATRLIERPSIQFRLRLGFVLPVDRWIVDQPAVAVRRFGTLLPTSLIAFASAKPQLCLLLPGW